MSVGEYGEGGEKATRYVDILWEMENGQKCFGETDAFTGAVPFCGDGTNSKPNNGVASQTLSLA